MREKRLTTVPPCIRENELEEYLATDNILVDFFNEFLSLPTFAEPIQFNSDFGIFEVASDVPQCMENQLKQMLREQKPRNPIYDVTRQTKIQTSFSKDISTPPSSAFSFNPNYSTMSLNREQAIEWIKKKRFPAFLESDCYFEYRLAKLISQVEWSKTGISFVIDKTYYPWFSKSPPSIESPEENEDDLIMKRFYVSLGQATVTQTQDWFTLAKQSQNMITTDSITRPVTSSHVRFLTDSPKSMSICEDIKSQELYSSSSIVNAGTCSGNLGFESRVKKKPSLTDVPLLQKIEARRHRDEGYSLSLPDTPSRTLLRAYLGQDWDLTPQERKSEDFIQYQELASFHTLDEFSFAYVQYILKNSVAVVTGQPPEDSPSDINFSKTTRVFIYELASSEKSIESVFEKSSFVDGVVDGTVDGTDVKSDISEKSEKNTETRAAWCARHKMYDIGNRHEFERFKKFIRGTLGEKYWWLWIDIERLKVLNTFKRQKRQLDRMKKLYLASNGDYYLTFEVLFKLNLVDGDQWNVYNLKCIQSEVVKPLLLYWGPRFCVTHKAAIQATVTKLKIWHARQQKPRIDVDPFPQMVSLLPLRPKSCMPKITSPCYQRGETGLTPTFSKGAVTDISPQRSTRLLSAVLPQYQTAVQKDPCDLISLENIRKRPATACSNVSHMTFSDRMDYLKPQLDRKYTYAETIPGKIAPDFSELGSSKMERMLQSLYLENRAGYVFTDFCEKSGDRLWKNSTYFWFDLQDYHQLFYQETLHPLKLCKQAQFLYANYIAPSAALDIGIEQSTKNEMYKKIDPPFEDLFDLAEEYILTILLVPWMKMIEEDREIYGKVELVEEIRQLDSVYFKKLQALHAEGISKKDEALAVAEVLQKSESIRLVESIDQDYSEGFKSYSIMKLLNNRTDLEQFRIFLEEQSASVDLLCWIDIEQFRRMLHKNKEQRDEKSKDIKKKYLNKKYFFGPDSPATKEEQEQVMKSRGGWGQVLHEHVAPVILLDVQKYAQRRLENKWLPLFYTREDLETWKTQKLHMGEAVEDILIQEQEKKQVPWKHKKNWVISSKDIITFRKALMNPITALQFQHFVSLKGDLLGNGVIFWQEVQKYKDLCHSHCSESIIQDKITTIINCFINSAIPPALQIDIPQEQAQKIIEHRKELGPYVFREAQMTIFALLFKFWPKFCEFRGNLIDEAILPCLEREKKIQKFKKARELEEKAQRKKSSIPGKTSSATDSKMSLTEFSPSPSFSGLGREFFWSYSKYIEALEQERVLLQIQEDLEKKSVAASAYSGLSSFLALKSDTAISSDKFISPANFNTAFVKQRSFPAKDTAKPSKF
ncbi:regulator of G-protein signaling 22 isoform X1 [Crotalus tigris]|uniref:regulator of G-protein signaling 22 isoform X1 n=2 Tax=Crotalus tigris TaxID=88082 RepID=UPI00192F8C8B|nr:regulator of G-protein signaling 22 isoform X1 [Crotalus tigris]